VTARPRRVLYVGRLVEKKGGELLIRAMARVQEAVPGAELVMAGDGPLAARFRALAAQERVAVQFLGSVSSEEVKRQIDTARVFCLRASRPRTAMPKACPSPSSKPSRAACRW